MGSDPNALARLASGAGRGFLAGVVGTAGPSCDGSPTAGVVNRHKNEDQS